jgi:hypothetical protein
VDCGNCGRTNRDDSRFCDACGTPMALRRESCDRAETTATGRASRLRLSCSGARTRSTASRCSTKTTSTTPSHAPPNSTLPRSAAATRAGLVEAPTRVPDASIELAGTQPPIESPSSRHRASRRSTSPARTRRRRRRNRRRVPRFRPAPSAPPPDTTSPVRPPATPLRSRCSSDGPSRPYRNTNWGGRSPGRSC